MSVQFQNSVFHLLPNEVLIKILRDVDTFALLGFCELYECDFFFQDRDVIKSMDLSKQYLLHDLSPLTKKITFEYVNTLNINCLYWIPVAALRKFISKLPNLEVLYAIKTNLSITTTDIQVYNTTKITKLGVTVRKNDDIGYSKAFTITTLYINFIQATSLLTPLTLEMHFPQLTNLWIDLEEPSSGHPIFNSLQAGHKAKIFCRINAPIPSISFDFCGLKRYYNNRRVCQFYVMCCERFYTRQLHLRPETQVDESLRLAWNTLDELHCPVPYGPKDARRLHLNEASLYEISFQELNFHHTGPICIERCRQAHRTILKSKSATNIKRLCIKSCLLNDNGARDSATEHEPINLFKRKRIVQTVETHQAQDLFDNFPQLEHLEIFHCQQAYDHSSIQAYPLIAKFPQLHTLVVEVPITLDGSFLLHILKTCHHLECLKVTSLTQHESLNHHMSNALPHGHCLKDLRYDNHHLPLDKLLERLGLIKTQKLERLVLICNEIDKFSAPPLRQFLDSNPQLTFLYFRIHQMTENSLKMAQRTLNMYKKRHPSKVYLVKRCKIGEIGYPIPDVHFCDMMKMDSEVATLRPLEDFLHF